MPPTVLPDFAAVRAAATRIGARVRRTPLLRHPMLDQVAGGPVLVKPECLQITGSYKLRGAFNVLMQLGGAERAAGVITPSSGNFGQAVSWAASHLGIPALVVMPADAPAIKVEGTRRWGAEVVQFDRLTTDRAALVERLRAERGGQVISAFDHPHVIAGQGTAALEMIEDARALGLPLGRLVAPVGGGGLMAGTALAAHGSDPAMQVWGVQPEGWDHTRQSLAAGTRVTIPAGPASLCDALLSVSPGLNTFAINMDRLAGVGTVGDVEVEDAIRFAFEHLKLVVEPAGTTGLALVLSGRLPPGEGPTGLVLSGGNVATAVFARAIGAGSA